MVKPNKKAIIGIIGGIGCGKSTVAAEFGKLGCGVIDADSIAHELLKEMPVKEQIVGTFGRNILDGNGEIEREKLAKIVFSDRDKLSKLTSITHPFVLERCEELIEQYNQENYVKAIVLDMPLLIEVGWAKKCDRLVFVDCKLPKRAQRAKKIGIFSKNELKIRENFQISLDKKAKLADNAVNNNSDFSALVRQVVEIFASVVDN